MKIMIQTRCGCVRLGNIAATQAPVNIVTQLPDNATLGLPGEAAAVKKLERTFRYIGTSGADNTPIYMESNETQGYCVQDPIATISEQDDEPE